MTSTAKMYIDGILLKWNPICQLFCLCALTCCVHFDDDDYDLSPETPKMDSFNKYLKVAGRAYMLTVLLFSAASLGIPVCPDA